MTARGKTPRGPAALLAVMLAAFLAACGDEDFKNEPREPLALELTGVVQSDQVTVSPAEIGAGPVVITISNQTDDPYLIRVIGGTVKTSVGPVAPTNTATIRRTLAPGDYEVSALSDAAVAKEIKPAELRVGAERPSASGDLELP